MRSGALFWPAGIHADNTVYKIKLIIKKKEVIRVSPNPINRILLKGEIRQKSHTQKVL